MFFKQNVKHLDRWTNEYAAQQNYIHRLIQLHKCVSGSRHDTEVFDMQVME
jgi:hypothetical protein